MWNSRSLFSSFHRPKVPSTFSGQLTSATDDAAAAADEGFFTCAVIHCTRYSLSCSVANFSWQRCWPSSSSKSVIISVCSSSHTGSTRRVFTVDAFNSCTANSHVPQVTNLPRISTRTAQIRSIREK